jgi:hypothetical protein
MRQLAASPTHNLKVELSTPVIRRLEFIYESSLYESSLGVKRKKEQTPTWTPGRLVTSFA